MVVEIFHILKKSMSFRRGVVGGGFRIKALRGRLPCVVYMQILILFIAFASTASLASASDLKNYLLDECEIDRWRHDAFEPV